MMSELDLLSMKYD